MKIADVIEGRTRWCVIHGNCLDVLPTIEHVDHVITDPPYESDAHKKQRRTLENATQKRGDVDTGEARRVEAELPFEAISEAMRSQVSTEWGRIVRRWVLSFCQIEAVGTWRSVMVAGGLQWVRGGIWRKPDGMPQFTGDRPGQGFESIAISHAPGKKRWNGGGKHAVWTVGQDRIHGNGSRNWHPTQKPVEIMLQLVRDFTDPDDVVLDPFCGSASTGVACILTGRRFIGIEAEETYAKLAIERLSAEETGSTIKAQRAGQTALFGGKS